MGAPPLLHEEIYYQQLIFFNGVKLGTRPTFNQQNWFQGNQKIPTKLCDCEQPGIQSTIKINTTVTMRL